MKTNTKFMWTPDMGKNSFIDWFVPQALAGKNGTALLSKIMDSATSEQKERGGFSVTMQINGVQVPCEETFTALGEQYDRMRKRDAEEIANDIFEARLRPHAEFFDSLFAETRNKIAEQVRERLGIKMDDNGE